MTPEEFIDCIRKLRAAEHDEDDCNFDVSDHFQGVLVKAYAKLYNLNERLSANLIALGEKRK